MGERERCMNCRFVNIAQTDPDDEYPEPDLVIECRRFPPTFVPDGGMAHVAVREDGWCGEWSSEAAAVFAREP